MLEMRDVPIHFLYLVVAKTEIVLHTATFCARALGQQLFTEAA